MALPSVKNYMSVWDEERRKRQALDEYNALLTDLKTSPGVSDRLPGNITLPRDVALNQYNKQHPDNPVSDAADTVDNLDEPNIDEDNFDIIKFLEGQDTIPSGSMSGGSTYKPIPLRQDAGNVPNRLPGNITLSRDVALNQFYKQNQPARDAYQEYIKNYNPPPNILNELNQIEMLNREYPSPNISAAAYFQGASQNTKDTIGLTNYVMKNQSGTPLLPKTVSHEVAHWYHGKLLPREYGDFVSTVRSLSQIDPNTLSGQDKESLSYLQRLVNDRSKWAGRTVKNMSADQWSEVYAEIYAWSGGKAGYLPKELYPFYSGILNPNRNLTPQEYTDLTTKEIPNSPNSPNPWVEWQNQVDHAFSRVFPNGDMGNLEDYSSSQWEDLLADVLLKGNTPDNREFVRLIQDYISPEEMKPFIKAGIFPENTWGSEPKQTPILEYQPTDLEKSLRSVFPDVPLAAYDEFTDEDWTKLREDLRTGGWTTENQTILTNLFAPASGQWTPEQVSAFFQPDNATFDQLNTLVKNVFPDRNYDTIYQYNDEQFAQFADELQKIGRNPDTEALLSGLGLDPQTKGIIFGELVPVTINGKQELFTKDRYEYEKKQAEEFNKQTQLLIEQYNQIPPKPKFGEGFEDARTEAYRAKIALQLADRGVDIKNTAIGRTPTGTFSEKVTGTAAAPFEVAGLGISKGVAQLPGGNNKYAQIAGTILPNLAAGVINPPRYDTSTMPRDILSIVATMSGMSPEAMIGMEAAQVIKIANAVGLPTKLGRQITIEEINAAKANYLKNVRASATNIAKAELNIIKPEIKTLASTVGEGAGNIEIGDFIQVKGEIGKGIKAPRGFVVGEGTIGKQKIPAWKIKQADDSITLIIKDDAVAVGKSPLKTEPITPLPETAAKVEGTSTKLPREATTQATVVGKVQSGTIPLTKTTTKGRVITDEEALARPEPINEIPSQVVNAVGNTPPTKPPVTRIETADIKPDPGNTYAGSLRPTSEVVEDVVTSDNPVVRAVIGRTGINPSVLNNTPAGKALIAYTRQKVAAEELTNVAVSAALDTHAQKFSGRLAEILPINNEGFYGKTGKLWQDVFSNPDAYNLTKDQRAYIDDFLKVIDEMEAMRVANGLKPRATRSVEGWFYVPRKTKEIRGVELRRPSNASLQRHYDEATEGYGKGIRYDVDPRATLELHTRQAYNEIIEKELSEVLEPYSITAKQLVPEPVRTRMEQAVKARLAAERAARQRIQEAAVAKGTAPMPSTFAKKIADDPEVIAARAKYLTAKNAYSKAMEAARKAEVAPGKLFGRNDETIAVGQWRNRFYPLEEYKQLTEGMEALSKYKPALWASAIEKTGNMVRFLASVGDFAAPFIQGLPMLGRTPLRWAKATALHYSAFLDPTVQTRLIKDNIADYQWLAKYGVPIGDPEFFAAMKSGQGVSVGKLLEILPKGEEARRAFQMGGRQTFGRFQATYNTFLSSARIELLKAMQPGWKGTDEELASLIRNMTGGLDTRALGVGPSQRAVESTWLAFSPRLFRSTATLMTDAMRFNTVKGREALRSLGTLAAGAAGLYITTGLALGKDWKEIEAGLNPLNGKKFLSHNINGDWIGIGGQVRAITQFVARAGSAVVPGGEPIGNLVSASQFDNPLINFYMSRGAPAVNIVGGAVEAASKGNLNVLPYEDIDSLPDLAKHIGTSAVPFALQGVLEGQQAFTNAVNLTGLRTSPATEKMRRAWYEKAQGKVGLTTEAGYKESKTDFAPGIYDTANFYSDMMKKLKYVTLEEMTDANGYTEASRHVKQTGEEVVKKVSEINTTSPISDDFDIEKANLTLREKESLTKKLDEYNKLVTEDEKAQYIQDNPELKQNPKEQYLEANPKENAQLAIYGKAKLYTQAAYDEYMKEVNRLDIPDAALPEDNKFTQEEAAEYFKYTENDDTYDTLTDDNKTKYLWENQDYAKYRIKRVGKDKGVPDDKLDSYVSYNWSRVRPPELAEIQYKYRSKKTAPYETKTTKGEWWDDERYLLEHPDYYQWMLSPKSQGGLEMSPVKRVEENTVPSKEFQEWYNTVYKRTPSDLKDNQRSANPAMYREGIRVGIWEMPKPTGTTFRNY